MAANDLINDRITLVLVDKCAFRDANSDFLGISKALRPDSLTVETKGIVLRTHPVLENEIYCIFIAWRVLNGVPDLITRSTQSDSRKIVKSAYTYHQAPFATIGTSPQKDPAPRQYLRMWRDLTDGQNTKNTKYNKGSDFESLPLLLFSVYALYIQCDR